MDTSSDTKLWSEDAVMCALVDLYSDVTTQLAEQQDCREAMCRHLADALESHRAGHVVINASTNQTFSSP